MIKLLKAPWLVVISSILFSNWSLAEHSWGNYHWARTTSPFDLTIVNSTTDDWNLFYVGQAISDWSVSSVLNMADDPGATSKRVRRKCNPPNGKVRICNLAYGQTGWLGIAGIWIDTDGHITKGYTKLNDTYFSWDYYNKPEWKQSVTCQELGHNIGLSHQDEDFNNGSSSSCMDYEDPPNPYPDTHDYDQLESIYGHLDSYDSYDSGEPDGGGSDGGCNAPPGKGCNKSGVGNNNGDIGWGMSLGRRGQTETFIRINPDGSRQITYVTWAIGH